MLKQPEPSEEYLAYYQAMIDDAVVAWDEVTEAICRVVDCVVEHWRRALFAVYLSRWLPSGPATFLARHWPLALMPEIDLSFLDSVPDPAD